MNETPLHDILLLEGQLRQRLDGEESRLRAALELCDKALAADLAALEQELQGEGAAARAAACRAGEESQTAAVAAAQARAAALAGISDSRLCAVLRRQLPRLWPGRWHDHPHGQG
ncbi:MAG: hypothetical protein A2005_11600 [Desulfuromonadales bacterium GWC2_61_20]|nr:MAG: hypothetical protein A2005_11600 [Desulfuromonadales bacterium GWC2_61_20]HAD03777.1 hypothetical protein [Desulfuromonas sp.]